MTRLTRRQMLRLAGSAALVLPATMIMGCGNNGSSSGNNEDGSTSKEDGSTGTLFLSKVLLPEPFRVPLPIPPILTPTHSDATTDYYEIVQKASKATILPGLTTEIWGYNGIFPGPTIEARRGRKLIIHHRNELPVPTVVHLHGGKTPAEHDGYPLDLVLPISGWDSAHTNHGNVGAISHGERDYIYPVDQPAATLWYHDHRMDFTGPQVYRGLAGFYIVRDEIEDNLPLPKGERDIPLMICDRSFNADGSFNYPSLDATLHGVSGVTKDAMHGVLGDVVLVNGAPWPVLEVANVRYRFRFLNASNARRYKLALEPAPSNAASFVQIGSDLGLLAQPISHSEIEIAQAERFDVIIDFSAYPIGTQITLVNRYTSDRTSQIMRFDVVHEAQDASRVPEQLAQVVPLVVSDATQRRQMNFARQVSRDGVQFWTINGRIFDAAYSEAQVPLNSIEIWKIHSNVNHPVHLHLGRFQVLTRNGKEPGPYDAGWKDTIDLKSNDDAEIIIQFEGYPGRYVFHCHNLEHEDMMMMANFDVV